MRRKGSGAAALAAAIPPYSNTGGKSSGCEVRTDYLTVTASLTGLDDINASASIAALVKGAVGDVFGAPVERGKGMLGYSSSMAWEHGGVVAAWGGQRDTVMISIPGQGCELVQDWHRLVVALRDGLGARITRWDGAADDHEGKHSVDDAAAAWMAGRWTGRGRPPRASQAGNWMRPDGSGRTLYVGSRRNGKMARVYEKGKQLGDKSSKWTRWEVELHRVDREIPWDAVTNPRSYIAGSYPAMAWIDQGGPLPRIPTNRKIDQIKLDYMMGHAAASYGKLLYVLRVRGMSTEVIFDRLARKGVPARLETEELLRQREQRARREGEMPAWMIDLFQQRAAEGAPRDPCRPAFVWDTMEAGSR